MVKKKKTHRIQLLKCEYCLVFLAVYDSKLTVCRTKQDILRRHCGLWELG